MSVAYRLARLFAPDGKCFDVAVDHGFFGEKGFLSGIENMPDVIRVLVEADPDAIQLSIGQAPLLQAIPGKRKPALVLRTDIANLYGTTLPRTLYSRMIHEPLEHAIRLDAACVVANLFMLPGQPEVWEQCVQNIMALKPLCERYGMPLMIEPLVMQANNAKGGYMVDGDIDKIMPLVRQAIELGADIIKADPTDDVSQYHRVIEMAAGKPVLVRGGGKVSDEEILKRTYDLMQQGAMGIVYGRNVIQHEHPAAITRALMAVVHDNATPEQAMSYLRGANA
ncbi:MAG: aldolase [Chloroflexi bacterium]|uniref:class I fructose-bisphosphate aldolase n=1 Tax=Candidatus Flexifilum breve TaxID=3140694 RepID=UPI0031354942|nr:aldolase [Chloroflexota bacterium]